VGGVSKTNGGKPAIQRINAGKGHWYKVDGRKADGVTTLIKNGRPNPALVPWAAREVAEYVADNLDTVYAMAGMGRDSIAAALKQIPFTVVNRAGVRGTTVHKFAEKLAMGEEVEYPDDVAGHVESYVQFLDEWQVRPVLVEAVVASRRWGYAGTTDLVSDVVTAGDWLVRDYPWLDADIPAGTPLRIIADPKTSRSGVWPDAAYQLAAYWRADVYVDGDGAEQPMDGLGIQQAAVVHVRADGYDLVPVNAGPETFKTFTYLATVARRTAGDKALIGAPIIPAFEGAEAA
jgi:hypothetical protein